MTSATLLFLGELGFTPLLVRLAATGGDWPSAWRKALTPKLIVTPLTLTLALSYWGLTQGLASPGALCLLATAPGLLAAAFNLTPILYALGAGRRAAIATYLRWAIFGAGVATALQIQDPQAAALLVGGGFSAGLIAQGRLAAHALRLPPLTMRPTLRGWRDHTAFAAGRLYLMMLVAALHDRAPAFLIEAAAPRLLASALLLTQLLSGITGLLTQLDRVILPILSRRREEPEWRGLVKRLSLCWQIPGAAFALLAAAGLFLIPENRAPGLTAATPILLLLLAEWLLSLESASLSAAVIAGGRDGAMARNGVLLLTLGLVAQAALFPFISLPMLLTTRIAIQFAAVRFNRGFAGVSAAPGLASLLPFVLTAAALALAFAPLLG